MISRLRIARRIAALLAVLAVCLFGHAVSRALGRRSRWPRRFLALAARACGARVAIAGTPLAAHVLHVANHISWLDILALGGATGAAFVSKAEVADWPIAGRLARIGRTIFVRRERRGEVRAQADALGDALAAGPPVALFPEGETGNGAALLPFKPALFAAAAGQAGLRVQPVRIDYGAQARTIAWTDDEGAGANARRLLALPGTRHIRLDFLAPLDAAAFPDRKALAAAARDAIDAAGRRSYTPAP